MLSQYLKPQGQDPGYHTSLGCEVHPNLALIRQARPINTMDSVAVHRTNQALWSLLHSLFDITHFPNSTHDFSAAHAYQLLNVLLYNRTHNERVGITKKTETLFLLSSITCAQLLQQHKEYPSVTVLPNILNSVANLRRLSKPAVF